VTATRRRPFLSVTPSARFAFASNEVLCFRFTLPIGTGNALQNQSTTATFTFDAEQTANNP